MKSIEKTAEDKILLIDDEEQFLLSAKFILNSKGFKNIITEKSGKKGLQIFLKERISCVLLDMMMPDITGEEVLGKMKEFKQEVPVIILTALNDIETAVRCMTLGAYNYLLKPVENERLAATIKNAYESYHMRSENELLSEAVKESNETDLSSFSHIITKHDKMVSSFRYLNAVSKTPLPILILGETGTGKELVAKGIHNASGRKGKFVAVNISGVDDTLFSDTLFGHRRGAFTGADKERRGLIEDAEKGTLFLDEIGDLSKESQVKLLRVIQERTYFPLGSDASFSTDARIVAATHRNLADMMKKDLFRQDLYYRLRSHTVSIPPLRERKSDIPLLVEHFIRQASKEFDKKTPCYPKELVTLLSSYAFPGNVRELQSIIYDAVGSHSKGILSLSPIKEILSLTEAETGEIECEESFKFPESLPTMKKMDDELIAEAMKRSDNNQEVASRLLGISRQALNKRLSRKKKQ